LFRKGLLDGSGKKNCMKNLMFTLVMLVIVSNLHSQNVFKEDIIGVWKLKQKNDSDTFLNFGEYLRFINNEIHFFDIEDGEETNATVIKFKFMDKIDFLSKGLYTIYGQLIKFPNGEVWELKFENVNDETRLFWIPRQNSNGEFIMILDERGIIKDPERRKKAYEREIHTYYIKL
jgi:hypothetical protein